MDEAARRGLPSWLIMGNEVADVLAGEAAELARLPATERGRVLQTEQMALVVRRRLLRATLDALSAEAEFTPA
eukprot:2504086-Pyramimonas_sp.AAC.1